jgi:hypothetical protein
VVIQDPVPTALTGGEKETIIMVVNINRRLKARILLFFNLNPPEFFYKMIHITLVLIRFSLWSKIIFLRVYTA